MKLLSVICYYALVFKVQGGESKVDRVKPNPLFQIQKDRVDIPNTNLTEVPKHRELDKLQTVDSNLLYRMVKYSGAAYCQDLTLKTWLCRHCRKLAYSELVFVASDLLTGGKGYVALDHTLKTIVVAIRGSTNVRNWIVNLNLNRVNLDVGDGTRGISVHEGFQQYAQAITNKLLPTIALLLNRYNYTLTFTGHSLGGAVATLTSIAIKNEFKLPWSSINLVTFGEPRVGNVKFATWINQHNPNHARVVNDRDMVAHVPDQALGYVHRRREIFISDGNIKPCGIEYLEDPNCSLSRKHLMNIWDHAVYLDVIFGVVC